MDMDNASTPPAKDTLPLRLATAAVGIPLLALCVWLGSIPLLAITAAATFLGIWELRVLLRPLGRVLWPLSALAAAAFLYSGHTADMSPSLIALTVVAGGSLGAALFTYRTGSWDGARSWTTTIGASVYPAALLATGLASENQPTALHGCPTPSSSHSPRTPPPTPPAVSSAATASPHQSARAKRGKEQQAQSLARQPLAPPLR